MNVSSTTNKHKKAGAYHLGHISIGVYWIYPTVVLITTIIEMLYIGAEVMSGQINFQSPVLPGLLLTVFSFLSYLFFFFFGFLMYLLWRYKTNYYVRAVPLHAIFRIDVLVQSALLPFIASISLAVLQSFYTTLENSKILTFLVYFLLAIAMNVALVLIYRGGMFIFSPGGLKMIRRLKNGLASYIVGAEVCELLEHISDARGLSLPEYSFLLSEVNASVVTSLKITFPRLFINGIDRALVSIQLSIVIGSENELKAIRDFFRELKKIFEGANLRSRFKISKDILVLLGTVDKVLPDSNKLRDENDIMGHWNLRFRDKLDPYIDPINVLLLIISIIVGILFGLHILP